MFRLLILIAALALLIIACSYKPVVGPIPDGPGPYVDVTFATSEPALTNAHPEVTCKQMPNPVVRMCHGKGSSGEDVSSLFYSRKLININGHTQS